MDNEQISQEIRDLNDAEGRHEASIDALMAHLAQLRERDLPAAVGDVTHRLTGLSSLVMGMAGTAASLAAQIHSINDRLTLLERVIDNEVPPVANDP